MKYIDRKGNITIEEKEPDKLLRYFYADRGGRLCLEILVRSFIFGFGERLFDSPLSRKWIPGFIKKHRIDRSEIQEESYHSFNGFLARKLKPGARPVSEGEKILISPCDGRGIVCRLGRDTEFYLKDTRYSLKSLLKNQKLAERFTNGYGVFLRPSGEDSHRYFYPAEGEKSSTVFIPGTFSGHKKEDRENFPVLETCTREYTLLKTRLFGTILIMEIGDLLAGRIHNLHKEPCHVDKGQEKGYFSLGGGAVALLFQPDKIRLDFDLIENSENGYETIVKMGERIGEQKLSKRTGKTSR